MANPITSVEINIIPRFAGDYRELPLFLEIAENFYNRYSQNANVPNGFLLDCIKSRLEGEPLRIIASHRLQTKDVVFASLREMYSDPRSELTLELDVTNFTPKNNNIITIGNNLRELISFYDTKLTMNVIYNEQMKRVKSDVFKQMALQAFIKAIMLVNLKLGEYLINKDIQTLDQAITLARNQHEWLAQFEKYSKISRNANPIRTPQTHQAQGNRPSVGTYHNEPQNPKPYQNFHNPNANKALTQNNFQKSNQLTKSQSYPEFNSAHKFNRINQNNYGYENDRKFNNPKGEPMELDSSRYRATPNISHKKPIMGFSNGRRVFQIELSETPSLDEIVEENFWERAESDEGT